MRWLSLLAGCAALGLLLAVGGARAQSTLGAPAFSEVKVETNSFEIAWSAPTDDGGSAIVAYDLRYIRSDAMDKADANWTVEEVWTTGGGILEYELKDLPDGTKYDLQLRADNGGDGPWTDTREATTSDHSDSRSGATLLGLGSSVPGSIDPSDDEDYFRIVLTSETDLWVYASGSDDTVGEVQRSNGTVVASNDDGILLDGRLNFSIRAKLSAGTYYVRVTSFKARDTASYTIHARAATDPGATKDTATAVSPDSMTPGRISPVGGTNGDKDYFKLELNSAADVWVTAVGDIDTFGVLLDADDNVLVENDDSELLGNDTGFMLRSQLAMGTYYIKVTGYRSDDTGPYTLFVRTATEPASTLATARPMALRIPETGRISAADDEDYFSLTLEEETYIYGYALAFGDDALPLTPTIFDSSNTAVDDLYVTTPEESRIGFTLWGKLAAGTYRIKVAPSSGDTGTYLFQVLVSTYGRTLERCTGLTTAQSDPWYGCAWHLSNTNQFPDGAGRDINVEEVWATTMGAGINIAVVDDGLQYAHEDLAPNVITARNHDYFGDDVFDPLETHGTRVAGIIAARDNDLGGRGVAPRASIYNYNVIVGGFPEDVNAGDAMTRNKADTAVSNNSWGPPWMLGFTSAPWEDAIVDGVTNGYGGKGVFYVFAAGNDDPVGHDSNLDEYANHYGVTAVCAVNHNDVKTAYSERGANLWVCAPSGDGTRGLPGIATTRNGDRYTDSFSGTSASAPIVSGVAALVRAANSDLTWRDVKLILAASARKNDASNSDWERGALKYGSTSARYNFNHDYGFGVVDAGAAVALAQNWTNLPTMREIEVQSGDLDLAIPDAPSSGSSTRVTTSLTVDSYVGFVEFVEVNAEFDHPSFRDLLIFLVSPSGTKSRLVFAAQTTLFNSDGTTEKRTHPLTTSFRFGSARHLGENATGTWTLRITDEFGNDVGTFKSWSLKIYGHGSTAGVPLVTTTAVNEALAVEWTAPDDTGDPDAEITSYDVRYAKFSDMSSSRWTLVRRAWIPARGDLRYVIRNLVNGTKYDVQVRAVSGEGDGRWSEIAIDEPALGNTEPEFPGSETGERSVDENTPAGRNIGDPVAARDDDFDTLTYTLGGGLASFFDIVEGTGRLLTREPLNHEGRDSYTGTIMVSDSKNTAGEADTAIDAVIGVTITVEDVDEAPEVFGRASIDIPEDSGRFVESYFAFDPEGGTVGLSLVGTDSGDFEEFGSGVLRFPATPDYENPADSNRDNTYLVRVEATDGTNVGTLDVTVNVTNVEEAGSISLSSLQPQAGTRLTATLSDPDGRPSAVTWEWERSPNGFSSWTPIDGAASASYTPTDDDVGDYLRVTASYTDPEGSGKNAQAVSANAVQAAPIVVNNRPVFPSTETRERSVDENTPAGRDIGDPVEAMDDDNDTLTYSLDTASLAFFDIDEGSGQLWAKAALDREKRSSYSVRVTATDPSRASATITVAITIVNVDEDPVLTGDAVVSYAEGGTGAVFTYRATDPSRASATITVAITIVNVDEDPVLTGDAVVSYAEGGTGAVFTYRATDPERETISWSKSGTDSDDFEISDRGVLSFVTPPDYDSPADAGGDNVYRVTVAASDPAGRSDSIDVTVNVTEVDVTRPPPIVSLVFAGGGGGGGGPSGPIPSDEDFEWNVTRDIEELDSDHGSATGTWSDGTTLWILENGDGADDAIYAYDLESGERVEDREFELDDANLAPRSVWSDRHTIWISDSGKEKLFAHDLASGDRLPDSDLALHDDNDDPRGIWSNGSTLWVLDGRDDALFGYDLAGGELLGEYALDDDNDDPRGIWSDRVSVWVSDHGAKRLFAYRLPAAEGPAAEDAEPIALERVRDEEFDKLPRVSNNSPRGLWSDGDVMYVADASDGKVYSYNMPTAIDARLASLELSRVDFGEFSPLRQDYASDTIPNGNIATLTAVPAQPGASLQIGPADHDGDPANGYHVRLLPGREIIVTVTSPDGSRMRTYRLLLGEEAGDAGPAADCLRGAVTVDFSLLVYGGGSVEDLETCAQSRGVTTLYVPHEGEYVPYILGAPAFANEAFVALYAEGLPALTPLIAKSEGPPSPAPGSDDVPEFGPDCLRGVIATGFSLVLYEGGSVEDLDACAQSSAVTTVYALVEGNYLPYILGAPEFVNEAFVALFPDGLPPAIPLVVKREPAPDPA